MKIKSLNWKIYVCCLFFYFYHILIIFLFSGEKSAYKGLLIATVLALLNQMCGSYTFITYASAIFERSGAHLSPNTSSIILAIVQISGTFFTPQLIETQGRKPLLIISFSGCVSALSSMGTWLYCDTHGVDVSSFNSIPVASLAFNILVS